VAIEELRATEIERDDLENTGLCLSCFNDPGIERLWIKNDDCPSSYDWVLP
jgi:hypothetical protein